MQKVIFCALLFGCILMAFSDARAAVLFHDDFNGSAASCRFWHIPVRKQPPCGTFIGRTRFRCTRDSGLPAARDGNAIITLKSYDPTRLCFYGTDLISNKSFVLGHGIKFTVRAKMNASAPGIVGGIFLYAQKPGRTKVCDEIDFELLTNLPGDVHTNVFTNGGPAHGDPQIAPYASGSIAGYHTYEIEWLPNQVSWFVDGNLVRKEKRYVPSGPMNVHLNLWAPDTKWNRAYSPDLKPVGSAGSGRLFSMSVESVDVESVTAGPAACLAGRGVKMETGKPRLRASASGSAKTHPDLAGRLPGFSNDSAFFGPYHLLGYVPVQ